MVSAKRDDTEAWTENTRDPIVDALIEEAQTPPEEYQHLVPVKTIERGEGGKFLPGTIANPKGRGKGVKNRMTVARLLVEEALRRKLANKADKLMDKAIQMALDGDEKVLRALLDKLMASPKNDDGEMDHDRSVTVVIQNSTGPETQTRVINPNTISIET